MNQHKFSKRHIGPDADDIKEMLKEIGVSSLEQLINETVPNSILDEEPLAIPEAVSEDLYIEQIKQISSKNKLFKSYIGLGYSDCVVPPVILRNVLENPGWYTQYTPYQAEISQGRLEALLNFQTMVCDLTSLPISNASLLDEATAAAEAMTMLHRLRSKELVKNNANCFFVSEKCFPQTIDVLKSRSEPLGIELVVGDHEKIKIDKNFFGVILQYPNCDGKIVDYSDFITESRKKGVLTVVAADLLSLTFLKPPGEFGADVAVGSAQRLGVPMGFGGPHAAYFATREEFKRQVPGRIIGVSIDRNGKPAYRMALQTREQHIRREKATSNICTAQALLAIMASMYAVYHGPDGLKDIALNIHSTASTLSENLKKLGLNEINKVYFDTLQIDISDFEDEFKEKLKSAAEKNSVNFRYSVLPKVFISVDETTTEKDIQNITENLC